ncbi:manganese-dependent inorganic pyrophosphatase [Desulfonispora thiosulfatigenes DSM 11270]|uniref:inorganic diphosphatase n=1 Tax=Desulfonispora thiosulfatigenes DSM 11270 TaxID=656914 RepID=A0A1W1VTE7_DESTI|nr:manganese-dependent inorganic pyrophosphatase [Desulfonispora thiosulfatigenes DSM 11270]
MVYIFGHTNPDTDSVSSAIALSYLKNKIGLKTTPYILGSINKETGYVLDFFGIDQPKLLDNVKTQVKDLNYDKLRGVRPEESMIHAYRLMEKHNTRTLPIVDDENTLLGIVTMKDIAMYLIKGDFYHLKTQLKNIVYNLDGAILIGENKEIEGNISVISYYHETIVKDKILDENSIVIVGDRYDIIEYAINSGVELIIVTGGNDIPNKYIELGKSKGVSMILVNNDTYTTSMLLNQCNYISSIMKKNIVKFNETEYLDDVKEELSNTKYYDYPVVNEKNKLLGFISRRHILSPEKKNVILVDHNEYTQSAEGLRQAEILEIVDHHKIGDIVTQTPINFKNMPVGSTCTIIYYMFKEYNVPLNEEIAGLLCSGIISDTLLFLSPTTTILDKNALSELNKILNLDIDKFAMDMFRAGSSLEGQSIEEIFYKDFKEFNIGENKIGIGQVFTLDIEDVFNRKNEFINYIDKVNNQKNYFLTIILVTDILKNGSYILFKSSNNSVIQKAFDQIPIQGMFVENLVSRKKQAIPRILDAINLLG